MGTQECQNQNLKISSLEIPDAPGIGYFLWFNEKENWDGYLLLVSLLREKLNSLKNDKMKVPYRTYKLIISLVILIFKIYNVCIRNV